MENKEYKELTNFIGNQFNRVWIEFDKVKGNVKGEIGDVKNELDHVKESIMMVDNKIDAIDKKFDFKFDDLKKDFRQLQNAVDAYANQANTYFMEMAALGSKLDRHERWINMIAEKVGLKLPS